MENKKAAILVLAIVAAVAIAGSGVYAMGYRSGEAGDSYPSGPYGSWVGPGMMGGFSGYHGGMTGGYGGYLMHEYMQQYWNSTSAP